MERFEVQDGNLICRNKHSYPVVDGIPVLLVDEVNPTHFVIKKSLREAAEMKVNPVENLQLQENEIDLVVQAIVAATCGHLYLPLVGRLPRYPIPTIRLPDGNGAQLLDIGCNWGRWVIAAARKGYTPIGIDPDLGAVLAARRLCRQLKVDANFVVGDARFLPFPPHSFDVVFSYSVIQHFSKVDARITLGQVARVLKPQGYSLIQMPNARGLRCLYHQIRRGFKEPKCFEVRYWRLQELYRTFSELIGPTTASVDGFFGLGIQESDLDLLPLRYRIVVHASEYLRKCSHKLEAIKSIADSLYLHSACRD